ncbi:MAG: mechanosensitive ion channel [Candidatus Brocadiia bacterium]|nr:mechanosensitive ion channel [Candidatus Brocadiia bacterium]
MVTRAPEKRSETALTLGTFLVCALVLTGAPAVPGAPAVHGAPAAPAGGGAGALSDTPVYAVPAVLELQLPEVQRQEVEKVRAALDRAGDELQELHEMSREERTRLALESDSVVRLRQGLLVRARGLATVSDCQGLLRYLRAQEKGFRGALSEAEQTAGAVADTTQLKQAQLARCTGLLDAARAGSLQALPPLAEWQRQHGEEFRAALAGLTEALQGQMEVLGLLEAVADARLKGIGDALALIGQKREDVDALKSQLFWQREPIPFDLGTVTEAADDLGAFAEGAMELALDLPGMIPATVRQMGRWRLLGRLASALVLGALGLLLLGVGARRARSAAEAGIARCLQRPMTAGNRAGILLLLCVYGEIKAWFGFVIAGAAWLLFVTLQEAYLGAAGQDAAAAGFDPWHLARAVGLAYAVVAGYRLGRRMVRVALTAEPAAERLLPLPDSLARHVARALRMLLLAGVIMLVPIAVLDSMGCDKALVSLLWQALHAAIFVGILWMVARRGLLERLLSRRKTPLAALLNQLLRVFYPAATCGVLFLILFRSIGFAALSRSIVIVALEAALGLFVISVVFWRGATWLRRRQGSLAEIAKDRPWLAPFAGGLRVGRVLSPALGLVAGAVFIVKLLKYHYWTAVLSPHAPPVVRASAEAFRSAAGAVSGWLVNPFYGESGMTPLSLLLGVVIVLLAVTCAGSLRRFLNRRVLARTGIDYSARHTLSAVIVYLAMGLAIIVGLNVSGVPLAGLGIFAGASGLAIGFGMQAILSNFVSGLIIMVERHVKAGDCVKVGDDLIGFVERINARSTTVTTFDNYRVIIPNSAFIEKEVINWSTQDPKLRAKIDVGIAYGSDTESARDGLLKVAAGNDLVLQDPAPEVRFMGFGDNALSFQLLAWVRDVRNYYEAISTLHFEIDREFRARGIEIAFPQRDLHLRTVSPGAQRALGALASDAPPVPTPEQTEGPGETEGPGARDQGSGDEG